MNHLQELEVLLYVSGENGLSVQEMSQLIQVDQPAIYQQLEKLTTLLNEDENSGLTIIKTEDRFKLVTKQQFAALIENYFKTPDANHLSQAALEVLAVIVYEQPITRVEIDELRGVQSSGALQTLVLRQLIEEKARKDAPGRPILYGTSQYFLDYFGLNSIDELPKLTTFQLSLDEEEQTESGADLYYRRFEETLNGAKPEEDN